MHCIRQIDYNKRQDRALSVWNTVAAIKEVKTWRALPEN